MILPLSSGCDGLASTQALVRVIAKAPTTLLYVGPDQILPLTSVFGAIAGIALMFWGKLVAFARGSWNFLTRRTRHPQNTPPSNKQP